MSVRSIAILIPIALLGPRLHADEVARLKLRFASLRIEARTDVSVEFAKSLVALGDALHDLFAGDAIDGGFALSKKLSRPIRVYAWKEKPRFQKYARAMMKGLDHAEGFYDYENDIVAAHGEDLTAYAHEMSHGLMARVFGIVNVMTLPLWIVEGIPDYVSAATFDGSGLKFPEAHALRLWFLKKGLAGITAEGFAKFLDESIVSRRGVLDSAAYSRAWGIVWYLNHAEQGKHRLRFQRALYAAAADPTKLASFETFFDVKAAEFRKAFESFFKEQKLPSDEDLLRRYPKLFGDARPPGGLKRARFGS